MKIALYVRVSTLDQNPEAQRRELEQYAARHEWPIVEVFEDQASGADPNRPALVSLLDAARKGRIDTVLVWKLDRFGRSLANVLENLRVLDDELVRFVSISEGIDTDRKNPAAKLLLHIMAAFAECERGMIRERCSSGQKRYQQDFAAGKVGRTVHSRSGKDLPPSRPRRVFDIERVKALRAKGATFRQISAELGVPQSTIHVRLAEAQAKTATAPPSGTGPLHDPALSHSPGPGGQGKAPGAVRKAVTREAGGRN